VELNDQVGASRPALGVIEQHAEHLRGHTERKVGDESIRTLGQAEVAQIRVHDAHRAAISPRELYDALAQSIGPDGIGLDRDDVRTGVGQRKGEGAGAGAELDQRFAPGEVEIPTSASISRLSTRKFWPRARRRRSRVERRRRADTGDHRREEHGHGP
jgi:hypothetical protein